MLGSRVLFVPGIFVLTFGVTLQAGATGAVRAVRLSAALTAGVISQGFASRLAGTSETALSADAPGSADGADADAARE